jgi:hypothetical protein
VRRRDLKQLLVGIETDAFELDDCRGGEGVVEIAGDQVGVTGGRDALEGRCAGTARLAEPLNTGDECTGRGERIDPGGDLGLLSGLERAIHPGQQGSECQSHASSNWQLAVVPPRGPEASPGSEGRHLLNPFNGVEFPSRGMAAGVIPTGSNQPETAASTGVSTGVSLAGGVVTMGWANA